MKIIELIYNRNYFLNRPYMIDNKHHNKIINIAIKKLSALAQVFRSDWQNCKRSFQHFISREYEVKSMSRMLNEDLPRLSMLSVILISIIALILIKNL